MNQLKRQTPSERWVSAYHATFFHKPCAPEGENLVSFNALREKLGMPAYVPKKMELGEALEVSRGLR